MDQMCIPPLFTVKRNCKRLPVGRGPVSLQYIFPVECYTIIKSDFMSLLLHLYFNGTETKYSDKILCRNSSALLTIARTQKEPKCPSTDEWVNKRWYIRLVEYYCSAIRRNEVLIPAATWINVENITLKERCQAQKVTYCMIPFI